MINSRSLDDLIPQAKAKILQWVELCKSENIDLLIYCTYRDNDQQNFLYASGRTRPGRILTNARGGYSFHNYRLAVDFVPMVGGKPQWLDVMLFTRAGELAEEVGLEWAGRWKSFKELGHVQYSQGLTITDLRTGKLPQ